MKWFTASAALLGACALAGCGGAGGEAYTAGSSPAPAAAAASSAAASSAVSAPILTDDASAGTGTAPASAATPVTTTGGPASPPARSTLVEALRPTIHQWPIPFPRARKEQMAAYSLEHYGEDTYVLSHPKVIVEHYTETATAQEAYNTFAPDVPDSEFHELPNTCAHFLVEKSGRIDQLVALNIRCRHTTGLNWTAIGIENVGLSDQEILDDHAQITASLRLTRWLRCRYGIALKNVIGHNESLSSPYHRDRVPAFQHQTHSDWKHADMQIYRGLLGKLACPS